MKNKSPFLTEMKRVRGLGAAHDGTHHFWMQRVTALTMIPLSVWFIYSLITVLLGADRGATHGWFQDPLHAGFLAIFLGAMFYHSKLGLQVIIEDYVHGEFGKIGLLLFSGAAHLLLGLGSLVAIAHLHFIGA